VGKTNSSRRGHWCRICRGDPGKRTQKCLAIQQLEAGDDTSFLNTIFGPTREENQQSGRGFTFRLRGVAAAVAALFTWTPG
jgi:hypothetical protein